MKKTTDELLLNLKRSKDIEQYFIANEEELVREGLGDYLYHLFEKMEVSATQAAQRALLSRAC